MSERSRFDEDDLVLHHYGEHPEAAALDRALAADADLRSRFERLREILAAATVAAEPVPERDAEYEARLWRELRPRLVVTAARGRRRLLAGPVAGWALAAGLAGLVAGAFLLGRGTTPPAPTAVAAMPAEAQARILRAAVARHLERVERLFVDLENGRVLTAAAVEGEDSPQRELLLDNRLYRSALGWSDGDARLARFLDEIEPLLAEVAHAPAESADGGEHPELRDRLRDRDYLFKLRVVLRRLHGEPERTAIPRALL